MIMENPPQAIKYPVASIFFIILFEFCERFNHYGLIAILYMYLNTNLLFNPDVSTSIKHTYDMISYFFPAIGAILADSYLGKFKVVLIFSLFYAFGATVLTASALPLIELTLRRLLAIVSLLIMAVGSGLIRPCITAMGGDQYKLPEQEKELPKFFSHFYYAVNAGSLLSMVLTPILRLDVNCFGELDCYSLAFGVLASSMVFAVICFTIGRFWYKVKNPSENMITLVVKCIWSAIKQRRKLRKTGDKREHWLDYAEESYSADLVGDTKSLCRIIILFLPLPMFWALYHQMSSRWTHQATRMNGEIGSYLMKPDHMQAINPFLVICFLPIFDYIIYPALDRCKISRPLQKITIGGIISGVSFLISGFIELQLESTYPVLPYDGNAQFRIFNGYAIPVIVTYNDSTDFAIPALGLYENKDISVRGSKTVTITIVIPKAEDEVDEIENIIETTLKIKEATAKSLFIYPNGSKSYVDDVDKPTNGFPSIRVLFVAGPEHKSSKVLIKNKYSGVIAYTAGIYDVDLKTVDPSIYFIIVNGKEVLRNVEFKLGGGYTVIITPFSDGSYLAKVQTVVLPNSMHMFWLIPQYIVITMGEVMFSVTGMTFTFSQAPVSMKSILQACWMLAISMGNTIVAIVAAGKILKKQSHEFFLFASLMFAVMVVFMIISMRYKYVTPSESTEQ